MTAGPALPRRLRGLRVGEDGRVALRVSGVARVVRRG
jgi:hypothetical protein